MQNHQTILILPEKKLYFEGRAYIQSVEFARPHHIVANSRSGTTNNNILANLCGFRPEAFALLRGLVCIVDKPDERIAEPVTVNAN